MQAGFILNMIVMSINDLDFVSYHQISFGETSLDFCFMRYMVLHVTHRLVFQARAIISIACHVLFEMARVDNIPYTSTKSTCFLDPFGTMTQAIPQNT